MVDVKIGALEDMFKNVAVVTRAQYVSKSIGLIHTPIFDGSKPST